jgi:6-phosphogluconolactonase
VFIMLTLLLALTLPMADQAGGARDEAAVRDVVKQYVDARDRGDAEAIAAVFTGDADQLTSSGEWRRGRDALVRGTLASSRNNPGHRTISIERVRFPAPHVAIADGRYEIANEQQGGTRRMWTSFVMASTGGTWRIAAIRNMLPASAPQTPATGAIPPDATLVYVGTYTGAKTGSEGIYAFRMQRAAGSPQTVTLVPLGLAAETPNPSFLEIDARRGLLFAVNEIDTFEGKPTGAVSAFTIDRATGKLTLLNQRPSMGRGPCHLVLDKEGRHLLVANYGSGTVAVLPVAQDGRLGEATAVVQHAGSSINPQRQKGPHAHCMTLDAANRFAFACDLGLDRVLSYRFDAGKGTLTPNDLPFAEVKPGAGPRHMVFRPDGRFAYVVNEMHSTVDTFRYYPDKGALTYLQNITTLPPLFEGQNSTAEIDVHPSGTHLYVSNRGHNSIAVYSIDDESGILRYVDAAETGGRTPRHFGIDPTGTLLAIGNQGSNTVVVRRIDPATGRLSPTDVIASVPAPVCIKFLPPAGAGR